MRKVIALFAGITLLGLALSIAQTTNQALVTVYVSSRTNYFLTTDDFEFAAKGMRVAHIDRVKLEQALRSDEAHPEDQDPLGNWGKPMEGLRMSLRFSKREYQKGEPITAQILIRNISDREIEFARYGTDWDFPFTVTDSTGKNLPDIRPGEPGTFGGKGFPIYPSTQKRFSVRLDSHFKFEPGEYLIYVKTYVGKLSRVGPSEISSAAVRLKILPEDTAK